MPHPGQKRKPPALRPLINRLPEQAHLTTVWRGQSQQRVHEVAALIDAGGAHDAQGACFEAHAGVPE
jgi:hypothetical protein